MKLIATILTLGLLLSGCVSNEDPYELKSPCVSAQTKQGVPAPCVRRRVNDHWLG